MKAKDLPMFKQKVLDMVPISQADMWKKLGIDSREGSSLVSIMLKENLIKRRKQDGRFILERANGNEELREQIKEDEELKRKEDEELKRKEDEEFKRKEDEELKRKEDEELERKEDEELKRKEDEELKRKEDEELKRKEDEELKRKEDEEKKLKDTNSLKKKVLDLLPITQSDMWKELGITSSAGSRLVDSMLEENLITRKKYDKTFILERVDKKVVDEEKKDYTALLSSKNRFAPCSGCVTDCEAGMCVLLAEWLLE